MENTINKNQPTVQPEISTIIGEQKSNNKSRILSVIGAVMAILLVGGVAVGSFYFTRNLNMASVPNAPDSEPAAACSNDGDCSTGKYCDTKSKKCKTAFNNDRCRGVVCTKPGEVCVNGACKWVKPTEYEAIPGYRCTAENCPAPQFYCANYNTCIDGKNPGLSVANDPYNCGGTYNQSTENDSDINHLCATDEACVMGKCMSTTDASNSCGDYCKSPYKCVVGNDSLTHCVYETITKVTPYLTVTPSIAIDTNNNPLSCGNSQLVCSPSQKCDNGTCVNKVTGADKCGSIVPDNSDGAGYLRECCAKNIGANPNNKLEVDTSWHWTHCEDGYTCRQGVGCFATTAVVTGKPKTTVTKPQVTTTVVPTATVTTTITVSPTGTISPTETISPTATVTITAEPTPVGCNYACTSNNDCESGLVCDSDSGRCRKPICTDSSSCVCPTATASPEPTTVGCNKVCVGDNSCSGDLICDENSGRCRNIDCSSSSSCKCPTNKPTGTDRQVTKTSRVAQKTKPTVLPETGMLDLPGVAFFGGGLLMAIVGILLAL